MKKLLIFATILSLYSCAYFNTYYNAKKYYKEARKASKKNTTKSITQKELKNYEITVEKCKAVIRNFPDSRYVDDSLLLMSKSYYYIGDYENSKINLEELLRRYPESELRFEALLWSGRAAWNMGRYTIAEEIITEVLNETKDAKLQSSGNEMLAEIYRDKKEPIKELEFLKKVIKYSKSDQQKAETVYRIGFIQKEEGNFKESINSFQKVETYLSSPELLESAKLEYTRALKSMGKTEEALDVLQTMFDSPRFKKIQGIIEIEMADISYREQDIEGAIERYGAIGIKYPKNIASGLAWNQLGNIYLYPDSNTGNLINYHYALEYYKRAIKSPTPGDYKENSKRNKTMLEGFFKSINIIQENKINLLARSGEKEHAQKLLHQHNLRLKESLDGILPAKKIKPNLNSPKNKISYQETTEDINEKFDERDLPENRLNQNTPADTIKNGLTDGESLIDSLSAMMGDSLKNNSTSAILIAESQNILTRESDEPVLKEDKKNKKPPRVLIREILRHQYLVAEYYYLDLGKPDSARVYFENLLSEYKDSEYAPKAALSLGLLYENVYGDGAAADSFYNIVLNDYPESPSYYEADRRLNDIEMDNSVILNPANELYEKAFYEGMVKKNKKVAIDLTNRIQLEYPTSDIAAKAAFLRASIVDQANVSIDSSLKEYNRLISLYPNTHYAKEAKSKVKKLKFLLSADDQQIDKKGKGKKGKGKLIK